MNAVWVVIFALMTSLAVALPAHARAGVMISQVQPGDSIAATNEAIELYNNSSVDQDITNWCVRYSSASSLTSPSSPRYCFTAPDLQTKIFLTASSFASIATSGYVMPGAISPDGRFSGSGMAASGGHMWLVGGSSEIIDVVGWGTAQFGEGVIVGSNPAPTAPTALQALHRKVSSPGFLQDTDDNRADFELKAPGMRAGGIYEYRVAVDLCATVPEIQEVMPSGYGYDESGNCELLSADLCSNILLIQTTVPDGLMASSEGCYEDRCNNLEDLQREVPTGYSENSGQCLSLETSSIVISELLPNVSGTDTGDEFIELYNPHSHEISLKGYRLEIGKEYEKVIELDDISIPALGYVVLYDTEYGFTLLNTTSNLRLSAPAGNVVSEVSYVNPKDDEAWAFIGDEWQYTNQVTPAATNASRVTVTLVDEEEEAKTPLSCPAGKYRHPITNRCRNIETDTSMLVACDADEYRNPETNRCRKIATLAASLAPCSEGSERNPETNRCRKVAGVSDSLAPCQEGYVRNPETNRCRKAVALTSASSAPQVAAKNSVTSTSVVQNTLIVTAGLAAAGYGLYEWRSEFFRGVRRIVQALSGK